MSQAPSALDAAYAHCEAALREADRDRWLAALFAPADKRRHLMALYAFSGEVARIRDVAREPIAGEVRLQWWIDALEGRDHGGVAGHPVAAALFDTVDRFGLSRPGLARLVEARRFDLYDDPMPSLNDLEGYAGETASVLIQQAAIVLCEGEDPRAADASGHAGVAYAMTGLARALPIHARRGQVYLPEDLLARHGADPAMVRAAEPAPQLASAIGELLDHAEFHRERALRALGEVDARALPAFVGLGLVPPYLVALRQTTDPFAAVADLPTWRKPLSLWLFSRRLRGIGSRR